MCHVTEGCNRTDPLVKPVIILNTNADLLLKTQPQWMSEVDNTGRNTDNITSDKLHYTHLKNV